jgi:hypothetical protein
MTDGELERAERIRRLQERRGTAATRTTNSGRQRSKHYNASRIVLAGLSVTSFFSILAAIGLSQPATPVTSAATPAAATNGPATPASTTPAPAQAKAASPSPAKPVTRSHGS